MPSRFVYSALKEALLSDGLANVMKKADRFGNEIDAAIESGCEENTALPRP
jgi:hypothetical protein